ncbi:sugar-binding protein [Lihuaxuella thermophila]|uniref:Ribose transport system substrate-binding protein n=1 Tax=Lihuaxuella thermophila TaxID=1173111 RepID=A0A1H8DJD7_9BACL|nr:sugar-binding protein [Lihuaxuella thermophila]SEN07333.1 ribose transport system substrate-binding protein [Lihuaxuella thermophila]
MVNYRKWLLLSGVSLFFISVSLSVYFGLKALQYDNKLTQLESSSKQTYHFVLIPEEMDNDYWRLVEEGAREAEKDLNVTLEYSGPVQADIEEHIKKIDMAIASKVDGIITQGLNENQFKPMINKAIAKGIPVITIDTDAPNSKRIAYVGTDNYLSGFLAGQALIKDTKGKAVVGIITGHFAAEHQRLRVQGFRDAVKNEPGIKIVAIEESNITRIEAAEKAGKILAEHPEVTAFYGTSALDAIGIAQVVERMGIAEDMYIIGFDTLPETLELLKKGTIEATVVQKPYEMGYKAVQLMLDIKNGKTISPVHHTETRVIHKEDLPLKQESLQRSVSRP